MGIVKLKNLPGLRLNDLLRRKRTTLESFIKDFGITTYEGLRERCNRIGVIAPDIEQFEKVMPQYVSSPTEGVIVIEPKSTSLPQEETIEISHPAPLTFSHKKNKKKLDSYSAILEKHELKLDVSDASTADLNAEDFTNEID